MPAWAREESERLFLRKLTRNDCDEFIELASRSRELHCPWIYAPQTPADFVAYLRRFERTEAAALVTCHKESREIAGFFTINEIIRGFYLRASVGYGVFMPNERQGYMKEGFELVFRYAFGKPGRGLGLHRLEADIQGNNHASVRLAESSGFKWEGISSAYIRIHGKWVDHERYAITSERAVELKLVDRDAVAYPPSLEASAAATGTRNSSQADVLDYSGDPPLASVPVPVRTS